jgi:hypothetical protein
MTAFDDDAPAHDTDTEEPLEEIHAPLEVKEPLGAYGTSNLDDTLRRYIAIQRETKRLEEERQTLRDVIIRHMRTRQWTFMKRTIDAEEIGIRCVPQTVVTYNEPLLRERLGNRYAEILDVDIKKVKDNLPNVTPLLSPVLALVGTPSREKVRDAIEHGRLESRLFEGAFTKTEKQQFAVMPIQK